MPAARAGAVLVLALLLAGCGARTAPPDRASGPAAPPEDGRLRGWGTVLDDGDGPELCVGMVLESLPPQCGGPALVGWDWSAVSGDQRRGRIRWGDYVVTGTYDGSSFTLTGPPVPAEDYEGPVPARAEPGLGTPCPTPGGGWRPVDRSLTTESALSDVAVAAARLDGYADLWLDQSLNPAYGSDDPAVLETRLNDPELMVVNVRVVGDPAAAQARLREVWGGALCVTKAERTDAELARVQDQVGDVPGLIGTDRRLGVVNVQVVHDDGRLQRRLDEEHGVGLVRVTSALVPLSELGG